MTAEDDRQEGLRAPSPAFDDQPLPLSRRRFIGAGGAALAGTTGLSLLAGCAKPVEEPWSDGTFWSDGTGWVEREGWFGG